MTSEPRTPSTPQSLAQLRDVMLEDHVAEHDPEWGTSCAACRQNWPCDAYQAATLLSVENVAAGLRAEVPAFVNVNVDGVALTLAAALLGAIGASHD